MRSLAFILLPLLGVGLIAAAFTPSRASSEATGTPEGEANEAQAILEKLEALRPDLPIQGVAEAEVSGYYAVELAGGSILYASEDGSHLFAGDLFEMGEDELVNLAEQRRERSRGALIEEVDPSEMVIFSPSQEPRAVIHVFTDIDCGYCRNLHRDMDELNALGIEVRYLAYPRTGPGTESYDKAVTAWCAEDRQEALTRLKAGEQLPQQECPNPVAEQYELGNRVGVAGTPAIVTEAGNMLPGYLPPEQLAARIGLEP